MALIPVAEALRRVTGDAAPLARSERVPLNAAAGRVLAEDLPALRTQPPFSASAMDGYAVRSADAEAPGATLAVTGVAAAGHGFEGTVKAGEAVRIFTGAPLPDGADSVVIQEECAAIDSADGDKRVRIETAARRGQNVRPAGIDFRDGHAGLPAGRLLDPAAIMLAAAMNHPHLSVRARPKVAILATGDELRLPGEPLQPGQIIASNSFGIAALVQAAGGEVLDLGIAGDSMAALDSAIDSALGHDADVLVTIGGASVGDHDLVQKAMLARGMALDFWKIAMRPGKPLMSGRLDGLRILGLPGNPASSMVCGYLFLEPLVAILAGRNSPNRIRKARLSKGLKANSERQDYMRGRLETAADGTLTAVPLAEQDSSLMRVFAEADCLIIRPPHAPEAPAGAQVDVLLLG
ncbi:molybdopterin molybdotransferase MoeA [Pseudohoeflea coraliihabitans]|uniref:Molybdopterin molybdenumtransferase n=1 Tax=Pseudohoeflea coraliihabitans TaxID=2860393 RepID=A0ABS6WR77_9HYPH|nr:gephyrin-like molybdotransferase Glp [Pseudohoeflea sp. DP4N28-3]MBW3098484.1 molybdopterin molybdotransferase MoeA [Pseudohoeflea sp. DP4N28-3]